MIGRVFWDDAVVRLGDDPLDQVEPRLTDLRVRELIDEREHSTFVGTRERLFRHALLRDVVYDGVLRVHRRAHHRTAAEWLREAAADRVDEQAANIAEHLDLAGEAAQAAAWYAGRRRAPPGCTPRSKPSACSIAASSWSVMTACSGSTCSSSARPSTTGRALAHSSGPTSTSSIVSASSWTTRRAA